MKRILTAFIVNYEVSTANPINGVSGIIDGFVMTKKEDAELEIKRIIENLTHKGWLIFRDDFRVSKTRIDDKIIIESMLETHPEYFI